MKTTIKTLFTIVAISVSASVSYAQTTDGGDGRLDRQVDVSRDYAPEVKGAQKLLVMPNMSDTVALRPDFDYTITPSAWTTGFGVAAINPVRLEASTYNPV